MRLPVRVIWGTYRSTLEIRVRTRVLKVRDSRRVPLALLLARLPVVIGPMRWSRWRFPSGVIVRFGDRHWWVSVVPARRPARRGTAGALH